MFSADSKLAIRIAASPNFDARAASVDMILLHYTGMESTDAAEKRLCDPTAKVSSHYLVYEDGTIVQMVPEARRAWHAGVSSWQGVTDINSCSIGIEIANSGHEFGYTDFPKAQIDSVIALCRDIVARHKVPAARVLAHSDVAPARKNDPGEKFPWDKLAAAGVGLWVEPTEIHAGPELDPGDRGEAISHLQTMLKNFGYGIDVTGAYDTATTEVITAFQRHFRPARVDGFADHSTTETLKRLLLLQS
ncbi:MAG: N-acetylmuramoyl-L-alanine amidase [Xanthobacteraceae bacterium]